MFRLFTCMLVLFAVSAVASGQQPNSPVASLSWNGADGPPWPITGVPLVGGSVATLRVGGQPYAPFLVATSGSLIQPGVPVVSGSVLDLDPASLVILFDPMVQPAFALDATGAWEISGVVPTLPSGVTIPYQAAVLDATAPELVTLSAATEIVTTGGIHQQPLALGDDDPYVVDVGAFGVSLPYFGIGYTALHVCPNGVISFGSSNSDFTSNPTELQNQMPRVAMQWCDLAPGAGGSVNLIVDTSGVVDSVRIDFIDVPDYGGAGANHTFSYRHLAAPAGDIQIDYAVTNLSSIFSQMVGLAPGGGGSLSEVDLTAVQDAGGQLLAPGTGVYEWYGYYGQAYYGNRPTNTFDLIGRSLNFAAQNGGAAGYYVY